MKFLKVKKYCLLLKHSFLAVLGDFNPHEHPPGYVSQYKLLLKQYDRLEDKIAELHQEFK